MTLHRRGEEARPWFTPREPDRAVRRWGEVLARSGRRQVLDIGCGAGRHVVYLLRLGMSVTAGDLSPLALAETQRWLAREQLRANLVQLQMTALPLQSGSFDAVLSVNVLQHAQPTEARAAVREVWRVLRPGGLFLAVMAGPGNCHCLLERPSTDTPCGCSMPGVEHDLRGLFGGFHILETQRRRLRLPEGGGAAAWRGVNWRVWAERPAG